ncbi:MAG: hypothetical protein WC827_00895 [Candidatus Paceibacterota bacterium]|jgi:hypothetical protein
MFKQKIFIASFVTLIIVASLNYFGGKFYWYWTYKWFDIPMHMLGGLWISLFSLSLYAFFYKKLSILNYRMNVLGIVAFAVLSIGVSWELFELLGGITSLHDGTSYWIDTISDIMNDSIGGLVGYFFFIKNRKCESVLSCETVNNNQIK